MIETQLGIARLLIIPSLFNSSAADETNFWFYVNFPFNFLIIVGKKSIGLIIIESYNVTVPVPENTVVSDVKNDSATFTYNLTYSLPPNHHTRIDNVQLLLTETEIGMASTIIVKSDGQPIPLKNLKPGTNYTVQARNMATDGRNSSYSCPLSFTTGSFSFLSFFSYRYFLVPQAKLSAFIYVSTFEVGLYLPIRLLNTTFREIIISK